MVIKGKHCAQPRLVAWFGPFPYEYSGLKMEQTNDEWPAAVSYIHDRIKQEIHEEFNSVLINLYRYVSFYAVGAKDVHRYFGNTHSEFLESSRLCFILHLCYEHLC